ncbi:MAG: tetratricopeptide repeat protein [Bacteroidales bacterium]|nr:tetratricopeptide repeat protein [Bacteroidales bacterium]
MKKAIVLIFFSMSISLGFADESNRQLDTLVSQANRLYTEGMYNDAISLYRQAIDTGYVSSELYYNLGNAFFKKNDMPWAILYYERALQMAPNDQDIKHNLEMAREQIPDKIDKVPELFYIRWWKDLKKVFAPDEWAKVSMAGFFLLAISFIIFILGKGYNTRKTAFWMGVVFTFLTLVATGITYDQYREVKTETQAIVFTPSVTVKSEPDEDSGDLFVIHEGTKVEVKRKIGDWREIRIENGSEGWIRASDIRNI